MTGPRGFRSVIVEAVPAEYAVTAETGAELESSFPPLEDRLPHGARRARANRAVGNPAK